MALKYAVLWLNGYYNGRRSNTIIEQKVSSYCSKYHKITVMDAVKNVLGWDK